ncbi:MAG: arginine--tRNA ligase [Oscillospiraceae bacterium]|nr:arginine--tRNA ligase [Oscillospiraceae bacterium]
MGDIFYNTKQSLKDIIYSSIGRCIQEGIFDKTEMPPFIIEEPTDKIRGDFSTNIAMVSAKTFKNSPIKIAEEIGKHLILDGSYFEKYEIAGPGFINFFVKKEFFIDILKEVYKEKEDYGKNKDGRLKKVMVEFVSANPTGPMHIGNARGGSLGDSLANILKYNGYNVEKEFYINDAGNQIEKFGKSLEARYMQEIYGEKKYEFPEDGYQGEDIKVHIKNYLKDEKNERLENLNIEKRSKKLVDYALPINLEKLEEDLLKYGIKYDNWFKESSLYQDKIVEEILEKLEKNGYTYEKDGAIWYRGTALGEEQDSVLIRENKNPTYFAADIAYHYNKFEKRKFDKVINIWGADHHGHVGRIKGSMNAIGLDGNKLDIVLMQLVRLVRDGEVVKVSKRTGKSITLVDLLEEVPLDAARFFFNMKNHNTHLEFDLDLAIEESSNNPVYYVQYAYARICSIIKYMEKSEKSDISDIDKNLNLLEKKEEIEIIRFIGNFPEEIREACNGYDPSKIVKYSMELATYFHKFYNNCRVHIDDVNLASARYFLILCIKILFENISGLINIKLLEEM